METLDNFLDKLVADLHRSCDLSDPTCFDLAVKQVMQEMQSVRLPITERQARKLLTTTN